MTQITVNPQGKILGNLDEVAYDILGLKYYKQTTKPMGTRWIEISETEALGLTDGVFSNVAITVRGGQIVKVITS